MADSWDAAEEEMSDEIPKSLPVQSETDEERKPGRTNVVGMFTLVRRLVPKTNSFQIKAWSGLFLLDQPRAAAALESPLHDPNTNSSDDCGDDRNTPNHKTNEPDHRNKMGRRRSNAVRFRLNSLTDNRVL
jgi:hypothetical protein